MIGQERLLGLFETLISKNEFPRFCILIGPKGSGKKTVSKCIVDKLKMVEYTLPDVKIDTIRQMIEMSYQASNAIVYLIHDADGMSVQAKNSLLKITEEPPNNAYFIMTLESAEMTLDTIRSRATIYQLDSYSTDEITQYARRTFKPSSQELDIIKEICDVPGDVNMLYEGKPVEFYNYVKKVVDNIEEVEGANAFKISDKLALKQDGEGYDVKLFLRAFMAICVKQMRENEPLKYATGTSITSKYINQLGIKGVSKQMLIDSWILEIRKYWMR